MNSDSQSPAAVSASSSSSPAWRIRVDTGGTFTDCFGLPPDGDGDGSARFVKVLSSGKLRVTVNSVPSPAEARLDLPRQWSAPDGFFEGFTVRLGDATAEVTGWDAASGMLSFSTSSAGSGAGVLELDPASPPTSLELSSGEEAPVLGARLLTGTGLAKAFPPIDLRLATTRGTNALLEGKGAPAAFFITRGFGDLLRIRDQRRPDLFALEHHLPEPLYQTAIEVPERLAADGSVIQPLHLDDPALKDSAQAALGSGVRMAAVALLHGYRNPEHETQLRDWLLELGFEHVSLSSQLAPLIKILPRAETAVVDAYLTPVMQAFIDHVRTRLGEDTQLLTMTSAGGLETTASFRPKDSLLSGPAGGVVGAAAVARSLGFEKVLTFDMGGTSTDVARYDGDFQYRFEQRVGAARLLAPALKIATVASGGGSICQWTEAGLRVGPESAGADPGPACYGRGGPLTITDVNLLLGRIDPDNFGIPLGEENLAQARERALELQGRAGLETSEVSREFLLGLAAISTEQMADAIRAISVREGVDPADYALVAFGGAGPLHACDIAERLGVRTLLVPPEAGLLSAYGLHAAVIERFAERQVLGDLETVREEVGPWLEALSQQARQSLEAEAGTGLSIQVRRRLAELRFRGQDTPLAIDFEDPDTLPTLFRDQYHEVYGFLPPGKRAIELVSLRVVVSTQAAKTEAEHWKQDETGPHGVAESSPRSSAGNRGRSSFLQRHTLEPGGSLTGPLIVQDPFSTLFLKEGWSLQTGSRGSLILTKSDDVDFEDDTAPIPPDGNFVREAEPAGAEAGVATAGSVTRELFRHRFESIVTEMGAMLQRSAVSTNVKEREDFSCALLDGRGELVVNAPHIPVHLGALGLCVREVARQIEMRPGDTIVTNHPAFGGSHLPDVTLITPVFDEAGTLIAYVANRAHHAELGGISPGSMPANATCLAEEGVVIAPTRLIEGGEDRFDELETLLLESPHPTRNVADNLSDLRAQAASNHRGAEALAQLIQTHGGTEVRRRLDELAAQSQTALRRKLEESGFQGGEVEEHLDDGTVIRLTAKVSGGALSLDFTGTSHAHPGNLNATPAIVRSVILYCFRLWTQSDLPLNEGLLRDVSVHLPTCFLNPEFPEDPNQCPAVVGGNVETSQRVVDTILKLFAIQACSQGTMNNLIFGDDTFGYYETIGGGAGAGPGYGGASGLHTHMTNTAITDPEILEHRYPVRLETFALRKGSGGKGKHRGGDGLVREFRFLKSLTISLLTQHRTQGPYGLEGGEPGASGQQILLGGLGALHEGKPKAAGEDEDIGTTLDAVTQIHAITYDRLRLETPGGGGFGEASID